MKKQLPDWIRQLLRQTKSQPDQGIGEAASVGNPNQPTESAAIHGRDSKAGVKDDEQVGQGIGRSAKEAAAAVVQSSVPSQSPIDPKSNSPIQTEDDNQPAESPTIDQTGQGIGRNARESASTIIHGSSPESKRPDDDEKDRPSKGQTAIDSVQMGLDAAGVADPTPITDGVNAAISLVRAFKDPKRRGEHLQNAAISAVSMVPYIGDTAKLLKGKRYAKTISNATHYADEAKAAKGATKAESRESLRDAVDRKFAEFKQRTAESDAAADAGLPPPPDGSPSTNVAPPDPPGQTRDIESERETEKGLEQQERWNDWLKQSTEKVIQFTGVIGKITVGVAGAIKGLELLNTGVIALNRGLAEYNGQLAQAYAEYEADEIQRKIEKGQAVSGPMSNLLESQSELKESLDEIRNPLTAILISLQSAGTSLTTMIVEYAKNTTELGLLVRFAEWFQGKSEDTTDWKTFFQDVSDGKFDGMRPTFDGKREKILPDRDHREVFGP